jgi:hypothetical protein
MARATLSIAVITGVALGVAGCEAILGTGSLGDRASGSEDGSGADSLPADGGADAPIDHTVPFDASDAQGRDASPGDASDAQAGDASPSDASHASMKDAPNDGQNDAPNDAQNEAGGSDAAVTGVDAGLLYNDMTNPAFWSTFDTSTKDSKAKAFSGAAFDGQYVYFVPNGGGFGSTVTRYDTHLPFGSGASWSTFDTLGLNPPAAGFVGAAFDGRYVYLVPNHKTGSGLVVRYDTQAAFQQANSWSTFDMTTVYGGLSGYCGAVYDGHHVYFVPPPFLNGRLVARYDAEGDAGFNSTSSWDFVDVSAFGDGDMCGAVFDGRFVYLAPTFQGTWDGIVPRYDTTGQYGSSSSWLHFDTTSVNAGPAVFFGGAFDGRFVYLARYTAGSVTRYDTVADAGFTSTTSWSVFDTSALDGGTNAFQGAAFDGRFVYFVPTNAVATRFDTQSTFTTSTSWSTFDMGGLDAGAGGFAGAAFDGRYLYFVPNTGGVVARFEAKTLPSMPKLPAWNGSFF